MTFDIYKYMRPFLKVKALGTAFETGLIKAIDNGGRGAPLRGLPRRAGVPERGTELLLRSLAAFGIVRIYGGRVALSTDFRNDMAGHGAIIRELSAYMDAAYGDMQRLGDFVMTGIPGGGVRAFFNYESGREVSDRRTALLSGFSKLYATLIGGNYDFRGCRYVLDVGGNDGEFLAGLCRMFPKLKGGVFDLPEPCASGLRKHGGLVKSRRLEFFPGDFFTGELPRKADLLILRSVLNDWPREKAALILSRAYKALPDGGKLLVIERLDKGALRTEDDCLFDMAFLHLIGPALDFRTLPEYSELLREAGFSGIKAEGGYPAGFSIIECSKHVRTKPPRRAALKI